MIARFLTGLVLMLPLLMGAGCAAGPDRPAPGVDDASIEMRTMARLTRDADLGQPQNAHVTITSANGIVLLTGEVRSDALQRRLAEIVRQEPAVRRLYDQTRIGEPASLTGRASDAWIAAKVRTKLLTSDAVDSGRIKVVTDDGTVYLLGKVTRAEANAATATASATEGVRRIVRVFEYFD